MHTSMRHFQTENRLALGFATRECVDTVVANLALRRITRLRRSRQPKDPVKAPSEGDGIKEKERQQAQVGDQGGGGRDV